MRAQEDFNDRIDDVNGMGVYNEMKTRTCHKAKDCCFLKAEYALKMMMGDLFKYISRTLRDM